MTPYSDTFFELFHMVQSVFFTKCYTMAQLNPALINSYIKVTKNFKKCHLKAVTRLFLILTYQKVCCGQFQSKIDNTMWKNMNNCQEIESEILYIFVKIHLCLWNDSILIDAHLWILCLISKHTWKSADHLDLAKTKTEEKDKRRLEREIRRGTSF